MPERRPNESLEQFAIRCAYEWGHFWSPDVPDGPNVRQQDLALLRATDPVVVQALVSLAKSNAVRYTRASLDTLGRLPHFDGQIGPAMTQLIMDPEGRCPIPDYAPPPGVVFAFDDPALQDVVTTMQARAVLPALGVGNWQGCHQTSGIHCVSVMINPANLPSFVAPVFKRILQRVQAAYAGVGLLIRFIDQQKRDVLTGEEFTSNVNIDMSFVTSSSGWIGLAIVGTNQTCGDRIWCRFLATYRGGQSEESIITQWTTLLKHELGHNCGFSHSAGGVMNPSIVNGLAPEWSGDDPTTPKLRKAFSGTPVPIPGVPGPPDGPGGGPVPPTPPAEPDWRKRVDEIHLKNVVQDVQIQWLTDAVRKLREGR